MHHRRVEMARYLLITGQDGHAHYVYQECSFRLQPTMGKAFAHILGCHKVYLSGQPQNLVAIIKHLQPWDPIQYVIQM